MISILEQSPRSPRGSTPSTPALSSKKSSFSLKRSTRSKVIPTTVGRSSSRQASPSSTNSGTKAKDLPIATSARELSKVRNERLLQALEPLEVRSYSFPAPSIPPPLPEQARLKPSKSLNDLLSAKDTSSRATSRRVSIVSSSSTSGKTCVSYSEESMIESCYPALCTPPRTPRSRHASIEWFVDFRAVDEDGKLGYVEVQEVACDESTLMPDILGPPIELLLQKEEVQSSIGEGLDVTEEERSHNRSSEVYDSLMELIESFPSPTVISTSTFTTPSSPASSSGISPSNVSSPSNSLWSFQHTNTASTSTYSPTSTMAVVTPVSEIPRDKLVPESGYFTSQRGGDGEDETVGHKEGYTIEDEEGRMNLKDENLQGRVSRNVLASHRALTDVLDL